MDWITNPTRPWWQFILILFVIVLLIGATIWAVAGVIARTVIY